ncbi:PREDICTED: uncharacterized protein LOC109487620 [Branchiostoma belcheri]|uniref:Uncharacterized protein LOC109487620 n=1 Tax=Branchiostoma belcheri TaxID=7741 RepID=A0A6P5AC10_BRABE|nr:PREDICTED: uncharacterized protein LOC109487620 [Branchiostoma belcheri]
MESPQRAQKEMEDSFNCPICLAPRLRMVTGLCQHRVCESCLYDDSGTLSLKCCPVCQEEGCFRQKRPIIPEDSILAQRQLGVVTCPNDGCQEELWKWELVEHRRVCAHIAVVVVLDSPDPPAPRVRPRVTVQEPERPRRFFRLLIAQTSAARGENNPDVGTAAGPSPATARGGTENAGEADAWTPGGSSASPDACPRYCNSENTQEIQEGSMENVMME